MIVNLHDVLAAALREGRKYDVPVYYSEAVNIVEDFRGLVQTLTTDITTRGFTGKPDDELGLLTEIGALHNDVEKLISAADSAKFTPLSEVRYL